MAVRPLKPATMTTVTWKAGSRVTKGQVVQVAHGSHGFTLAAAKKNEWIEVCVACDLVEFDNPDADETKVTNSRDNAGVVFMFKDDKLKHADNSEITKNRHIVGIQAEPANFYAATKRLVWKGIR